MKDNRAEHSVRGRPHEVVTLLHTRTETNHGRILALNEGAGASFASHARLILNSPSMLAYKYTRQTARSDIPAA